MAKTAQEKLDEKLEKQYYKKHKSYIRLSTGDVVFNIINYSVFAIFTLMCAYPFYYLFIQTVSNASDVVRNVVNFIPHGFTLKNYKNMLQVKDLYPAFGVTLARTVIGTAVMVMATGFIGYLCTKDEMWNKKFWYRFMTITMYFNAGIIAWFLNMNMLGLTDHFSAYIIPGIVAPYNVILVKTYIESIPAELEESAFIDGAGHFTVFRKIIWPLCKPILATITIFGAVGHWNSFTDSLILMPNAQKLHTLQHLLYNYLQKQTNLQNQLEGASNTKEILEQAANGKIVNYTVSMVAILPILMVYPFMMRYFEKGIMLGAVKG